LRNALDSDAVLAFLWIVALTLGGALVGALVAALGAAGALTLGGALVAAVVTAGVAAVFGTAFVNFIINKRQR